MNYNYTPDGNSSAVSLASREEFFPGMGRRRAYAGSGSADGGGGGLDRSTLAYSRGEDSTWRRPKVTVITPTYNRPRYLPEAIESVLAQELEHWELFVINDGGVDVRHIVDRFDDPRITYINREVNRGKAACLNECLERARGEYVAYLDDDDIWYPEHLRVLAHALDTRPEAGVAYSDLYRAVCVVGEDGRRFVLEKKVEVCRDYNRTFMWHFNHTLHVSLMHRLELARRVGGYNEDVRVLIDWNLTRKLSFYTDFVHVARATGEYYEPVANSDRISDVQRRDQASFRQNLRRIRGDLPPEPWPMVDRVLVIKPMRRWDETELAAVTDLADRLDHPCRIALVNTAAEMDEARCRERMGPLAELGHVALVHAPGADRGRAYAAGAGVWQADYYYLVGDQMAPGMPLRLIRALGYMHERQIECVRWACDPVDPESGYEVLAARTALPDGTSIAPGAFAAAGVVPAEWPTEPGERRRFPLEQDMMLLCAAACEENGAWRRAGEVLDQVDQLREGVLRGPYLVHRHMQVAMHLGEFQRAETLCRRLIEQGYGADNYVRLGAILQHTERYQEAADAYRRAINELDLKNEDLERPELKLEGEECDAFRAMVGLGECLVEMEQDQRAGPVLRRAALLCANSHRPALAFGRMFLRQGLYGEAEEALRMAQGKDCGSALAEVQSALAFVYEHQGRVGEAYRAARQALQISPDDGTLLTAAVELARTLGRTDDVEELYRDFLRLRPGHVGALRGLAEICRRAGRAEEAERLSETAGLLSATMN